MNISFYNGVSGLIAYQQEMDVLSHNMANVNTVGFKGNRSSFSDLLYTAMDTNAQEGHITGHGVRLSSVDLMYTQGAPRQTGSMLDLAIIGEGLFAVSRNGRTEYTRNGSFTISVEGKKGYLVTKDGGYVLDAKGKPVELERRENSEMFDYSNLPEKVGVYQFSNPFGLEHTDGGSFLETELSGRAAVLKAGSDMPYTILQSALESSSVNLADEMVNLIVTQKAYQMNAKMVQTADQLEEIVNNLR